MNVVVLNEKIRKRNGDLQPIEYLNATYRFEGDLLVIEYDHGTGRATAKIPREHLASVIEKPE